MVKRSHPMSSWLQKWKYLATACLCVFTICANAANIIATVDRYVVGVNESIHLTFESDAETGAPDFSPLQRDFEILDRSQNQSLSIVNGKTSRKVVWNLILMATRAGRFQIPSISFGADKSQVIDITVREQSTVKDEDRTIYLDVEVDAEQPYVQQQVVFTVKLFRAVDVASATLSELEVEGVDAIVERLGEDKDYQILQNGRRWLVVERKYVVFPQQSGYMTIRPLRFKGSVVARQSNLGFSIFNQSASRPVALQSESVTLQVREPPASFVGHWLPATALTMEESWPERHAIKVGDPLTRSIGIKALGLTAAQLPELQTTLPDGLRSYPEQPKLENSIQHGGILGSRVEAAAIISTRAGTITLPEIQLPWWNVDKQQPEIATLPARTIEVIAAAPAKPEAGVVVEQQSPRADNDAEPAPGSDEPEGQWWWPWVSLGFILAWLITVILWMVDRNKVRQARNTVVREPRPQVDRKQALATLRRACADKNTAAARDALIEWGESMWPEAPPRNLGELARRCGEPLFGHIRDLERVLYAHGSTWDQNGLQKEVLAFKPDAGHEREAAHGLEPMYRT